MNKQLMYAVLAILAFGNSTFAQENEIVPTSSITIIAQYKLNDNNVELRFFADKKSVLESGMRFGYKIERAEISTKIFKQEDIKYQEIAIVKPYTEAQWKQTIQTAEGDLKKQVEVALSFYKEGINTSKIIKPIFDLKTLSDAKNAEDFQFAILLLSAVQKPEIAFGLGLAYDDKTVKADTKYVYKASLIKYSGPYEIVEVPYLITTNEEPQLSKREIDINEGDTKLGFTWEENDMVSGVLIERKNKETGKFEQLNKNPKYSLSENSLRNGFEDTDLENYQRYQYRFYGFNAFGEKILFGEETAMPRDLTPPKSPLIQSAEHTKPNEVTIQWNLSNPPDSDLKGLTVMRGTEVDGKFEALHEQLLDKSVRSYTDNNFIKDGSNYYVVQAIDTAGNKSVSYSAYVTLMDTIAPNIPVIRSSKIDSLGVVTLNLEPNKEKDLMGYRLFMANSPEHEFSAIQEDFDNDTDNPAPVKHVFNDTITLKSLSPYVYYKVKALDLHHNQSDFSSIYKIKRIDTIPPTTPVFKNAIVGENMIELHFALSQSNDVKEHVLYRKIDFNSQWEVLSKIEINQSSYSDKDLEKRQKYYYSLRAKDSSNLFSAYAMPISGKPYDTGKRKEVTNFRLIKNTKEHVLSWEYPSKTEETYFILYRSNIKGDLVEYQRITTLNFIEKPSNKAFSYGVRAFTKDGGASPMSKTIK